MAERPIERLLSIAQDVKRCGDAEGYTAVESGGGWICQAPIESFKVVTPPKEWRYITGIAPEPGAVMQAPSDPWARAFDPPFLVEAREAAARANADPSLYGTSPEDESEAEPQCDGGTIVVTDEMIAAGGDASRLHQHADDREFLCQVYRAMSAAAPSDDLVIANERLLHAWHRAEHRANAATSERDAALARIKTLEADCDAWKGVAQDLIELKEGYWGQARDAQARAEAFRLGCVSAAAVEDRIVTKEEIAGWVYEEYRNAYYRPGIVAAEQGNHDWMGPTEKHDIKDEGGEVIRTERRAVKDEVAERVHQVVGDVLAGKVVHAQREQLGDALGKAPKHQKSDTTTTDAPMPGKAISFQRQAIGILLPVLAGLFLATQAQAAIQWTDPPEPRRPFAMGAPKPLALSNSPLWIRGAREGVQIMCIDKVLETVPRVGDGMAAFPTAKVEAEKYVADCK